VTVTNHSTSVVQFSFFDSLRNRQQVRNESEIEKPVYENRYPKPPEAELTPESITCTETKDYAGRLVDSVNVAQTAEGERPIPELFMKNRPFQVQGPDSFFLFHFEFQIIC